MKQLIMCLALTAGTVMCGWAGGSVEIEETQLRNINEVQFNAPGTLYLRQDSPPSFKMEGPEKALDKIIVETKGNAINIKTKPMSVFTIGKNMAFYVTVPELREIAAGSSGNIEMGTVESRKLAIRAGSSGNISIDGVITEALTVKTSSSGDVLIKSCTTDEADLRSSSSGSIRIAGSTETLSVNLSSSGELQAEEFVAETGEIRVSSSGMAEVWVTDTISVFISSSGDVLLWGSPQLSEIRTSSSGNFITKGDK
jgi:hypothetical protein